MPFFVPMLGSNPVEYQEAPKAYLNVLVLDENDILVDASFKQVSTDAEEDEGRTLRISPVD